MVGIIIEFSLIVGWFVWMRRRQIRDEERARRLRPKQLDLDLEEEPE